MTTDTRDRPVIDRATPADLAMLAMDAAGSVPQQIGAVLVLDAGQGFDVAAAEELIADRIRSVPRLRQRLVRVPRGCGRPVWVDDAAFDAGRHVSSVGCPAPGDERALLDAATAMLNEPLDRSRPLWSVVFVTGLADGSVALVVVLDHVLADGIGGLAVLACLVDQAVVPPAVTFPRRPPSLSALAADAMRGRLRMPSRLPRFWREMRQAVTTAGGVLPEPAAQCSLLRPTGPRQRLEVVRTDLAGLRAAAHRSGGTVNDALLTAITGALHTLLESRGEHIGSLAVAVAVAARRTAAFDRLGNEVYPLLVTLPVTGDPARRLAHVAALLKARKALDTGPPIVALLGPLFRGMARLGLYRWYMRRQRRLHTLVSNMRGPDRQLTFAGAPIVSVVPMAVAESGNITVSFEALSYAGTLAITVMADAEHVPDLAVLVAALRTELTALTSVSGQMEPSLS